MNGMTETTTWIRVEDQLPDSDETVLLFCPSESEPVWPGYWDGDRWRYAEGMYAEPTCWAPMLKGPTAA